MELLVKVEVCLWFLVITEFTVKKSMCESECPSPYHAYNVPFLSI